jgi:FkbM family methyltransferase
MEYTIFVEWLKTRIVGRSKWLWRKITGRELHPRIQIECPMQWHGDRKYGGYMVCPSGLSDRAIVYSAGIGLDASFDLSLIEKYGMNVYAFDPTPSSIEWVSSQTMPPQFCFYAYGLAGEEGTIPFFSNPNPGNPNFSLLPRSGDVIEMPVRKLSDVMRELGHDHIDILKLNVEGAEFGVLDDIFGSKLDIRQILVQFHHKFKHVDIRQVRRYMNLLNRRRYRLFYWQNRDFCYLKS